jgi:DNA mismatch endonuclease (patch repair protein)
MDNLTPARRSENMRRIKAKHSVPEMLVRRLVHRMGYRYRLHDPNLPGKPDLVLASRARIIEVRGCFWHQHPNCIESHIPKTATNYWQPKLTRNQQRDKNNLLELKKLGWKVLVIWECETKHLGRLERRLKRFFA